MKNRALQKKLIRKVSNFAARQLLTSLPVVGIGFKVLFFAQEIVQAIKEHAADSSDPVPQLVFA
jgi:hypothetical protein